MLQLGGIYITCASAAVACRGGTIPGIQLAPCLIGHYLIGGRTRHDAIETKMAANARVDGAGEPSEQGRVPQNKPKTRRVEPPNAYEWFCDPF